MSEHMKTHHTKKDKSIVILLTMNVHGEKMNMPYEIPSSKINAVTSFLDGLNIQNEDVDSWEKATPWEELAKDRIEKYKRAGIVLRGARYREGMSQKTLSEKTGISQNNISKIENGKRTVGEKVAKRLSKVLNIDYKLLIEA